MNDIEKVNEYHVPVIICPNCGEKDKVALSSVNKESNLNTEDIWSYSSRDPYLAIHTRDISYRIDGRCGVCGTTFEIKMTATIPVNELRKL